MHTESDHIKPPTNHLKVRFFSACGKGMNILSPTKVSLGCFVHGLLETLVPIQKQTNSKFMHEHRQHALSLQLKNETGLARDVGPRSRQSSINTQGGSRVR